MDLTGILDIARLTDPGLVRDHNEDAVAGDVESGLLVLADGMGGYQAGEIASEMAVLTIVAELKESLSHCPPGELDPASGMQRESILIRDAVDRANANIFQVAQTQQQCEGMGTTLVVALFTNNKVLVGHIGDSRMYRLRGNGFSQLTEDHSLLQEQISSGLITPEQAKFSHQKNLVTRALGVDPAVDLELHEYDVQPGDLYLICSDGLSDLVDDEDIYLTLSSLSANLELAAHQLVQIANDKGGYDNVSVILARPVRSFAVEPDWMERLRSCFD